MGSFWDQFGAQTEEEKIRRKNAELDKKIGNKDHQRLMGTKRLEPGTLEGRQDKLKKDISASFLDQAATQQDIRHAQGDLNELDS